MELKINTAIGELTAVIDSIPISSCQNTFTAYLKDKAGYVVQASSIGEAIDELCISVDVMLKFNQKRYN